MKVAQASTMSGDSNSSSSGGGFGGMSFGPGGSLLPFTTSGYAGISGGGADFEDDCVPGFGCNNSAGTLKIYTGGLINQWFGAEAGYLHFNKADRNAGSARARGFNLSLVGNVPLSQSFGLHGRLGTTYARTKVEAPVGEPAGKDSGWRFAYGVGASYRFTPNWAGVVDFDEHRLTFIDGTDKVRTVTAGVRYTF